MPHRSSRVSLPHGSLCPPRLISPLPCFCQNHLQVLMLLVFEAVVYRRQEYYRKKHQLVPPPTQTVFEDGTRQNLDRGLLDCAKYFTNYFYYKFGLEVRGGCWAGKRLGPAGQRHLSLGGTQGERHPFLLAATPGSPRDGSRLSLGPASRPVLALPSKEGGLADREEWRLGARKKAELLVAKLSC